MGLCRKILRKIGFGKEIWRLEGLCYKLFRELPLSEGEERKISEIVERIDYGIEF